jgi:acyl-coenzyme A synthetase/AMP-(fatty) acid ligase
MERLGRIWRDGDAPFLIHRGREIRFGEIARQQEPDLGAVRAGDVVALIGDFEPQSIATLLKLIDRGAVLVPLTRETRADHDYFFDASLTDVIIEGSQVRRRSHEQEHPLLGQLRATGHPGLVLFSTGTTGRPKAILHDMSLFLARYETPRPALRTLNFLLFDHIGGINTLFHTLYNKGVVIAPEERTVTSILACCRDYAVEVLPTTPTFLRMMLISGLVPEQVPGCVRVITYGTERMDQSTLDALCQLLPDVDFRQTFGMSELGILRIKSDARDSLYMKIGGEGVETRVVGGILQVRSSSRMLGYLNASSPFDAEGWYDTQDVVDERNRSFKVLGRTGDVINVGGLKFMAAEVERAILEYPGVSLVKVVARSNPITGQHVEALVQPMPGTTIDVGALTVFLRSRLQPHMVPRRIRIDTVAVGHRFKRQ